MAQLIPLVNFLKEITFILEINLLCSFQASEECVGNQSRN